MKSQGFTTDGGAFDVQAFADYLETNEMVDSVDPAPTGMRHDGPPEFQVSLRHDGSEAGRIVLGDTALSVPDGMALSAARSGVGEVVFTVYQTE